MTVRRPHLLSAFALAGSLLIASYLAVADTAVASTVVYEAASVLGVGAVLYGLRDPLRQGSTAWRALSTGIVAWATGDLLWCLAALRVPLPWGHMPDAIYLASYAPLAWSLLAISRRRRAGVEPWHRQFVDAAILFVAAYPAVWFLLVDPVVDRGGQPLLKTVLTILYPTLDLALLALAARFAFAGGRWPLSYRLITAAFTAMFVADLFWRVGLTDGNYGLQSWFNALYMAGYLLWGAAALHRSRAEVEAFTADASTVYTSGRRRLLLLSAVALTPGVVFAVSHSLVDDAADSVIFALVIALLPLLSLVRAADMLRALRGLNDDFDSIIHSSPIPICVVDREGTVLVWNRAAAATSGYAADEVIGRPPPLVPAEDIERVQLLYERALHGAVHDEVAVRLVHREGHPVDVRVSTAPLTTGDGRVVALFEDVTLERRQQAEIAFLANHDPLTGLPNRRHFEQELAAAVGTASEGLSVHLAIFDLDNFKSLNDTGGHTIGDQILRDLAQLLEQARREQDVLARLSGDEFALILTLVSPEQVTRIIERLLDIARDYRLTGSGRTFDVTLSAGIYTLHRGDQPQDALRRADEALYAAKRHGKNHLEHWQPEHVAANGARDLSPAIKDALRDDRIEAHLQPIVLLATDEVAFYEALARLRLPDGRLLAAAEWIAQAEQLGLTSAIDLRILEKTRHLLTADPTLRVFVNLGAGSFHDHKLLATLESTLHDVAQGTLGIEITEHTAHTDPGHTAALLNRLRRLGATVAVDDFGLGFTSFTELATLPCDIVKIPSTFTPTAADSAQAPVVSGAISQVAHAYRKRVVIEGIETHAAALQAKLLGIEYAQGWHYGPAVPYGTITGRIGSEKQPTPEPLGRSLAPDT